MFPTDTYVARRKRLKEQVGDGVILLMGNRESPMNYPDNVYPFRQDSNFLYFFGLDLPAAAGLIDIDEDREIIYADEPDPDAVIWQGPQEPLEQTAGRAGVSHVAGFDRLEMALAEAVQIGRRAHLLPQYRADNLLELEKALSIPHPETADYVSEELIRAIVEQRSIKTDEEIAELVAALDICYEMHMTAFKESRPGKSEQQIAGLIEGVALSMGGRSSYPVIFSKDGQTLHNRYHGNVLSAGDIVINDSGSESAMHYAGDITRTIPIGGKFSSRQKDIYNIVMKAQDVAIEALKPGVKFLDVHVLACETLAAGLKELGLMKGDVGEAVAAGAHALFFQCGLGHMMGLDVHDMEDLGEKYVGYDKSVKRSEQFGLCSLRLGRELQAGFVVTVEPGLYFIGQLIDRWRSQGLHEQFINYDKVDEYRDFGGVRLEDDFLITEAGYRLLGKPIPKSIEEVEALASL